MDAKQTLINLSRKAPIIIIDGPRNSDQKALALSTFENKPYISLKDEKYRLLFKTAPSSFFLAFPEGAIIDEIQMLESAVDSVLNEVKKTGYKPGKFVLIYRGIYQDRLKVESILTIIPSSHDTSNPFEAILSTPFLKEEDIVKEALSKINKSNKEKFEKFLRLCAFMNGETLSVGSLAKNCGVSAPAASYWLEILRDMGIITFIESITSPIGHATVKKSLMYFYSPSLLCSLLGITNIPQLILSPYLNNIVSSFVVSSLSSFRFSRGLLPNLYFYQERNGYKVDLIAKWKYQWSFSVSSSTDPAKQNMDKLLRYSEMTKQKDSKAAVLYLGDLTLNQGKIDWISYLDWEKLSLGLNYYS